MADVLIPSDAAAWAVAALRAALPGVRVSTVLPDVVPAVHLWVSGGYASTLVTHRHTITLHAYEADGPAASGLCGRAIAALGPLAGAHRPAVLAGPYDNPHPDHPDRVRYTAQVEVSLQKARL